jgi:hypothetical protein
VLGEEMVLVTLEDSKYISVIYIFGEIDNEIDNILAGKHTKNTMTTHDIDNYNVKDFGVKLTLNAIFDTIKVASKCGGEVFGGFVRDVIVPYEHNNSIDLNKLKFKDVDIWFTDVCSKMHF